MSQQPESPALVQSNNDVITMALSNRILNRNDKNLSLSNEEVDDMIEQKPHIVNTVLDSNDVHINNTNNNFYNAPVSIHNFYSQPDKVDDVHQPGKDVPQKSFESLFSCKVVKGTRKKWSTAIFVLVIIILMIALIAWLFTTKVTSEASDHSLSHNKSEIYRLRIITREEWGAKPPRGPTDPLESLPLPYVIISHTETVLCYTQDQCTMIVQRIQSNHTKFWYDIGYNFLVGGDGLVYEGRGWTAEGAHSLYYNRLSIGISLIGTFKTEAPTKVQLRATERLIEFGVERGYIAQKYKLFGHRQVHDSDSPGCVLFNIIKSWKHWVPSP